MMICPTCGHSELLVEDLRAALGTAEHERKEAKAFQLELNGRLGKTLVERDEALQRALKAEEAAIALAKTANSYALERERALAQVAVMRVALENLSTCVGGDGIVRCFNCDEFMNLAEWPEHGNPNCEVGKALSSDAGQALLDELAAYREGWAAYEEFTLDRPGAMDRLAAARARIAALGSAGKND
jgi:hypothetical protein